ncbi:hypothetical protein BB561_005011 [Smittium simulii]|uniref:Uncharacterized protein n=1 Tax=Smittium simulii TaxID=133385 RepID=A0A2T9YCQ0_9FUNG|nr:hypothetical protein BB561_005011 [Smittium simulii]
MGVVKGIALTIVGNFLVGIGQSIQKNALTQESSQQIKHTDEAIYIKDANSDYHKHEIYLKGTKEQQKFFFLKQFIQLRNAMNFFLIKFEKALAKKTTHNAASKTTLYLLNNKLKFFGLIVCFFGDFLGISMALPEISTIVVTSMCSLSVITTLYFSNSFEFANIARNEHIGSALVLSGSILLAICFSKKQELNSVNQLIETLNPSPIFQLLAILYSVSIILILTLSYEFFSIKSNFNKKVSPAIYALISSCLAVVNVIISKITSIFITIKFKYPTTENIDVFEAIFTQKFNIPGYIMAHNEHFKSAFGLSIFSFIIALMLFVNTLTIEKYKQMALQSFKALNFQVFYFGIFIFLSTATDMIIFKEITSNLLQSISIISCGIILISIGFSIMAKNVSDLPRFSNDSSFIKIE